MFPRTFHARRITCRALFIIACLAPTTALVVYGAWRAAPTHRAAIRNALSSALAVQVTLAKVEHPRPGVTRIHGLELADPESGQLLLRLAMMEIRDLGNRYVLTAAKATLDTAGAGRLYEELQRRLSVTGNDDVAWQVEIDVLTLREGQRGQSQIELAAHRSMGSSGPVVAMTFRKVGDVGPQASEIKLLRNRQVNPAATTLMLQTGDTPLPCSLLGQFASEWDALGSGATFAGRFWTIDAVDGRRGELTGEFNNVDLNQQITRTYGFPVTGTARLRIHRALMHQGRLELAEATITAGPGMVSQHLLRAASKELQMPLVEGTRSRSDAMVAYQRLTAQIAIDGQGILIRGQQGTGRNTPPRTGVLPSQSVGVVLAERNGPILVEPHDRLGVTAVLRTLATGSDDAALIHGPVGELAKWLPQPSTPSLHDRLPGQSLNRAVRHQPLGTTVGVSPDDRRR